MWVSRFEKRESIGDNMHILGERIFDEEEEEGKEVEDLKDVVEMTDSINEIQS